MSDIRNLKWTVFA